MKLTSEKLKQIIKEQIREAMEDYPHNKDKVFAGIKDKLLDKNQEVRNEGKKELSKATNLDKPAKNALEKIEKISDLYYREEQDENQKIYDLRDMFNKLFGTQSNLGKEIRTKLNLR